MTRRRLWIAGGLLAPAALFGCSLVYPYGDVQGTLSSDGGDGTSMNDADVMPDQTAGHDASGDAGVMMTSDAQVHDASPAVGDADAAPMLPNAGVVVVGGGGKGTDGGLGYFLSVLSPEDGHELSRETMAVLGISYDGPGDLWYIFELPNSPPAYEAPAGPQTPAPDAPVFLHVRQLDTHTGAWTELGKVNVPVPVNGDLITPLTNRLAYVALVPPDAGSPGEEELVIVDTTNPSSLNGDAATASVYSTLLTMPGNGMGPFAANGAVGTRPLLSSKPGGEVALMQNTSAGGGGEFQFYIAQVGSTTTTLGTMPILIAPSASEAQQATVGTFLGGGPMDLFVIPGQTPDAGGTIYQYNPLSGNQLSASNIPFTDTSTRFGRLAVSECAGIAFIPPSLGTSVVAVPLSSGGTQTSLEVGQNVQGLSFEPYSNTLMVAFSGTSFGIAAVTLGGTNTAPTLVQRTFVAPADLHPTRMAVRSFTCH